MSYNEEVSDHDSLHSDSTDVDTVVSSNKQIRPCLFIGDLARFASEHDIQQIFSSIGKVVEVVIKKGRRDGTSLGYGFVTLETMEQAERAIKELSGKILCGRPMKIGWGSHNPNIDITVNQPVRNKDEKYVSIYVRFYCTKANIVVSEERLVQIFSSFGRVIDASVKSSNIDPVLNKHFGYGFVHFAETREGVLAAFSSIRDMSGKVIDDIFFQCQTSKHLLKAAHDISLAEKFPLPEIYYELCMNYGGQNMSMDNFPSIPEYYAPSAYAGPRVLPAPAPAPVPYANNHPNQSMYPYYVYPPSQPVSMPVYYVSVPVGFSYVPGMNASSPPMTSPMSSYM